MVISSSFSNGVCSSPPVCIFIETTIFWFKVDVDIFTTNPMLLPLGMNFRILIVQLNAVYRYNHL